VQIEDGRETMLDSDKDAAIARFLRWSHATVHDAEELVADLQSEADAAGVHFDDTEIFQELVLGLDKFVSGIKEVYDKISEKTAAEQEEEPAAEAVEPAPEGTERAA
jgi:hypothetical protein